MRVKGVMEMEIGDEEGKSGRERGMLAPAVWRYQGAVCLWVDHDLCQEVKRKEKGNREVSLRQTHRAAEPGQDDTIPKPRGGLIVWMTYALGDATLRRFLLLSPRGHVCHGIHACGLLTQPYIVLLAISHLPITVANIFSILFQHLSSLVNICRLRQKSGTGRVSSLCQATRTFFCKRKEVGEVQWLARVGLAELVEKRMAHGLQHLEMKRRKKKTRLTAARGRRKGKAKAKEKHSLLATVSLSKMSRVLP